VKKKQLPQYLLIRIPGFVDLKPKKKKTKRDCCPSCGREYDVNMGGGAYCPCAEDPPTDGVM
jgi:hypothetical protein